MKSFVVVKSGNTVRLNINFEVLWLFCNETKNKGKLILYYANYEANLINVLFTYLSPGVPTA